MKFIFNKFWITFIETFNLNSSDLFVNEYKSIYRFYQNKLIQKVEKNEKSN